ncbi:MAG: prepilin-type N-terminal cleavage/methylation domain-containing protein [Pyrinomonadaceae bacterium]|nr:prepilin-type N-terminal cleavage/methylation domain-containing protein [Pyrinomonadaceae bacterium]
MLNSSKIHSTKKRPSNNNEQGFSLLEVIVAILILTIALMGTAAALSYALEYGTTSRNVGTAKLLITSTMEEIESLRNTRRLEFKQIANIGEVDNTDCKNTFKGFSVGFNPVGLDPGIDGVNGTDDDIKEAGPDGILGTADDVDNTALSRSGYLRKITITPFLTDPTIKKVEINIKFFSSGGIVSEISGVGYLNNESRTTG